MDVHPTLNVSIGIDPSSKIMIKSPPIFFPILACALVNSRPFAWKPSAVCRCAGDSVAGRSPGPMSLAFCARAASNSYSLGRFRNALSVGWWGIVGVTVGFLEYIVGISSIQRVFFSNRLRKPSGKWNGKNIWETRLEVRNLLGISWGLRDYYLIASGLEVAGTCLLRIWLGWVKTGLELGMGI